MLAVAPLFLYPFCSADACATALLWLSVPAALWTLLAPSRRRGEMLHDARSRVARAVVRDPVLWILVALTVLAAVRWANSGIGLAYDAEREVWRIRGQTLGFLPGSVKGAGYAPFAALVALTVLFSGCRHSLGKKARISFLFSASALAALAAVVSAAAVAFGHAHAAVQSSCPLKTASYSGSAFGLWFLGGVTALVGAFECRWNKWILPVAFSACGTLAGLYFFAPAPVVLLYFVSGFLMLAVSCGYAGVCMSGSIPFKCLAVALIALALPVLCVMGFAPEEMNASRLALFNEGGALFGESFLRTREALSRIAVKVWTERPWLGTGLGSFVFDVRFNATEADWKILLPGQASALNGWWQLLAERGIIGALSFATALGGILYVFVRRLCGAIRRRFFLPLCVLGPLALSVAAVEALFDASFLRSDVMLIAGAYSALACSALPGPRKPEPDRKDEPSSAE